MMKRSLEDEEEEQPAAKRTESKEKRLQFAVVCSSNNNRSMEAHARLNKGGFNVKSFGSGQCIRLPGPTVDRPNVYDFGKVTYEEILADLRQKDAKLYQQNGLLNMLERNMMVKERPEKFQGNSEMFDVIITCESRVFDQIVQDFTERPAKMQQPAHVLNVEIKDNAEEAIVGAGHIMELADMLQKCEDLENDIEDLLQRFEAKRKVPVLHAVVFY